MSNELIVRPDASVAQLDADSKYATVLFKSGLFQDVKSEAQAVVKVMAGRELGLSPFVAMRDLSIIQGKIACAAAQIGAKIQASGGDWQALQYDDKGCILRFSRGGKVLSPDIEFNMQHAAAMGFAQKDNYRKQPRVMLFWRALTMGARMFFPAVFNGPVYTPDELRDGGAELPEPALSVVPAEEKKTNGVDAAQAQARLEQRRAETAAVVEKAKAPEKINPEVAQTLPTVTQDVTEADYADEIPPEENPWLHKMQGGEKTHGKYLFELHESVLKKAISPAYKGRITEADTDQITQALRNPSLKEPAKKFIAEGRPNPLPLAEDGIPNWDAEVPNA